MTLWVVRHAQPLIAPGVCYGALDVPVDAEATQHAAQKLAAELPHGIAVHTSVLQRCEQLAQVLSRLRPDLAIKREPRLVEMNFGIYEGVAWADIPKDALDAWTADFAQHRFGGQESVAEFMARVADMWHAWRAEPAPHRAWITHAGVARAAVLLQQGIRVPTRAQDWPALAPGFGAWIQLHGDNHGPGIATETHSPETIFQPDSL